MHDQPAYNRVRNAKRASYDRQTVQAILNAGLVGHVGFIVDGRPMVMPMIYAVGDDCIYLHGASKARIVKMGADVPLSMTVTLVDGIVAARSAFHHSMNYRCAVVHGQGRAITDPAEHEIAMQALTEHLLPDRYTEIRPSPHRNARPRGLSRSISPPRASRFAKAPPLTMPRI